MKKKKCVCLNIGACYTHTFFFFFLYCLFLHAAMLIFVFRILWQRCTILFFALIFMVGHNFFVCENIVAWTRLEPEPS